MSIRIRVHKHVYLVRYAHILRCCWFISYANDSVACIWTARVSDSSHQEMMLFFSFLVGVVREKKPNYGRG